ncbi:MAG: hypothetical protein IPG33_10085 [Betaproteobacteria bacterium]|nr:hypothetical protein [Betaproteobacteria bacterium]
MRRLSCEVLFVGLLIGMPAAAQQSPILDASGDGSTTPRSRLASIKAVTVYLHRAEERWSASLEGDVKDAATEKIEVTLADGSLRVLTQPLPKGSKLCLTKMKDREQFGYLECNSAFFSANTGSTAAATVLRGVLSLGILTVSDAASGNTGFTVSLDRQALDAAVSESKAIEFARKSAPLIEYRKAFESAISARQLSEFIARYEGASDPESLVVKAKEKLPLAMEQEEARAKQKSEAAARQAEAQRQQEIQRQAESEALRQFQAKLKPGDRVKMMRTHYAAFHGLVIEVKPPLAYIQWENVTPPMQWVRVEQLLPSP